MSRELTMNSRISAPRDLRRRMSPMRLIGVLGGRIALILLVAAVIVLGATAVGYSPLGAHIAGVFPPFAGGEREGPPPGVAVNGTQPQAGGPQVGRPQAERGRGGANVPNAQSRDVQNGERPQQAGEGVFSGRNLPSLRRGLSEELRYFGLFAALTAGVALVLRVVRPRRRRPAAQRASASGRLG